MRIYRVGQKCKPLHIHRPKGLLFGPPCRDWSCRVNKQVMMYLVVCIGLLQSNHVGHEPVMTRGVRTSCISYDVDPASLHHAQGLKFAPKSGAPLKAQTIYKSMFDKYYFSLLLLVFSTNLLKLLLSKPSPITVYPFFRLISWNYDHSLFDSHWRYSIGKCDRLSQSNRLLLLLNINLLSRT